MAVPNPLDGTKARIEIREFPGGAVIALRGDHDLSTRPQLLEAFRSLPRNPWSVVVIDLRQCTFVDSTIIGAILTAGRGDSRRVANVSVVMPDDTSYVYRALSIIGLRDLVPAHVSIEAALGALHVAV